MKQLAELISVTVSATGHKQQATAAATAAFPVETGTATATTLRPNDGPRLKMEQQKFSMEEEDLDEWHKVYSSQVRIHGFAEELCFPHYHLQRHGAENHAKHRLA